MHHHSECGHSSEIDTRLLGAGAALAAGGVVLAGTGAAMVTVAVASAARRWAQRHHRPSGNRVAVTFRRASEAARAGRDAWHGSNVEFPA